MKTTFYKLTFLLLFNLPKTVAPLKVTPGADHTSPSYSYTVVQYSINYNNNNNNHYIYIYYFVQIQTDKFRL